MSEDLRDVLRVNADVICAILAEEGVENAQYLAVKIANELDPPNDPRWDPVQIARLYLALEGTSMLSHEAARRVAEFRAAFDRGFRVALDCLLPAAEASEARVAEVYDLIVQARDLLHSSEHLTPAAGLSREAHTRVQDVFELLQKAKYGLGGRTNVAAQSRLPST